MSDEKIMSDQAIKDEVKKRMKEETPLTHKIQIGLSPITHLRKYLHKKQIIKENKAKKSKESGSNSYASENKKIIKSLKKD